MTKITIYNTIKTALEDNNYIKLYNLLNENVLTFCNTDTIFIQHSNLKPVFIKSDDFNKIGLIMPMKIKRGETND